MTFYRYNKCYELDLKHKTYEVSDDNQFNFSDPNDASNTQLRKGRATTVLGKPCTVYLTDKIDYYVWQGIVLKRVERVDNGPAAITEATSIQTPASLQPSLFEIPKGYRQK